MKTSVIALLFAVATALDAQSADLLFRGGTIVDGSGSPSFTGDVAITGDRIVYAGRSKTELHARREIDASGLVIAPGFIDPHTHTLADLNSPIKHGNEAYLMQGVTTVITGNDGASAKDIGATLEKWRSQGIGTNAALLVGEGTVRNQVLGMSDKAPDSAQLARMQELVRKGMDEGAIGMSTGLYYAPGSYATTEEVIALAQAAGEKGGIYDTHMRDESTYSIGLLAAVDETIRIGREGKLPVHISHIKALGKETWGMSTQVIDRVDRARAVGVKVTASEYPYVASGTSVGASLLPRWAEAGGRQALLERLDAPVTKAKLIAEMERNLERRGGADSILVTKSNDKQIAGKTLAVIATERKTNPVDAAIAIIRAGDAPVASFNMTEDDLKNFMRQDWVMTCSDGSEGHPRKYGTFPRKLRKYVYEEKVISLPFAIRSSTSLPAKTFGFKDRGLLKEGAFADVVVFDPKTIRDAATFEKPEEFAMGMRYVSVNGALAVDDGRRTRGFTGRVLAHH